MIGLTHAKKRATYQKNIQFGILISLFLQHKLMKYIVLTLKPLFFKLATSNILKNALEGTHT